MSGIPPKSPHSLEGPGPATRREPATGPASRPAPQSDLRAPDLAPRETPGAPDPLQAPGAKKTAVGTVGGLPPAISDADAVEAQALTDGLGQEVIEKLGDILPGTMGAKRRGGLASQCAVFVASPPGAAREQARRTLLEAATEAGVAGAEFRELLMFDADVAGEGVPKVATALGHVVAAANRTVTGMSDVVRAQFAKDCAALAKPFANYQPADERIWDEVSDCVGDWLEGVSDPILKVTAEAVHAAFLTAEADLAGDAGAGMQTVWDDVAEEDLAAELAALEAEELGEADGISVPPSPEDRELAELEKAFGEKTLRPALTLAVTLNTLSGSLAEAKRQRYRGDGEIEKLSDAVGRALYLDDGGAACTALQDMLLEATDADTALGAEVPGRLYPRLSLEMHTALGILAREDAAEVVRVVSAMSEQLADRLSVSTVGGEEARAEEPTPGTGSTLL